jgi:anthranilate synthase component 2
MKILIVDNYDSFTFNLVHLLKEVGARDITVRRNDKITPDEAQQFDRIVLSPGPGIPLEAGAMPEIVRVCAPTRPILGVCLGHQCIGEVFGGTLRNLGKPVHGKGVLSQVTQPNEPLFKGLPKEFITARYHSWVVSREALPAILEITAVDATGEIMALRHTTFNVCGVQFHPESVLTQHGATMMTNWLNS